TERTIMFTVIAERINMTRKSIREKVWDRNEVSIRNEVSKQANAGATHIDINAGGDPAKEIDDMKWLTEIVSSEVDLPISFDSANPEAIQAGLEICNRPGTIINSITMEKDRVDGILPLVMKYDTGIVCLTMDDSGMPEDLEGRISITDNIVALFKENGIPVEQLYFDHLVRPASTNPGQAKFLLDAIIYTKMSYPESHTALGLSNISFGIPCRNNFNKAFLSMLVAAGCDGAILDPTENDLMLTLYSARSVLGLDEYCMEYIMKMRDEGKA
ncbi:dihydropteroate synthase, partial [Candidatus Latescibacterota bacterium]